VDLDEVAAILADNGIDGPDLPYNPRALAAMRAADALLTEVRQLRAERLDSDRLRDRMANLLDRTAVALKGRPSPGVMHDWADLPSVATAVIAERDGGRLSAQRWLVGTDDDPGVLDRYEVHAIPAVRAGQKPVVTYYCTRVHRGAGGKPGHVGLIVRDVDGDQTGLTLGELAESALDHEAEHHGGTQAGAQQAGDTDE
jgi:hypothetical protein